jgi:hypothetical protein
LPDQIGHGRRVKISTARFLRLRLFLMKNYAKLRNTFAPLPSEFTYEKHAMQNYAKRFASIKAQSRYFCAIGKVKSYGLSRALRISQSGP